VTLAQAKQAARDHAADAWNGFDWPGIGVDVTPTLYWPNSSGDPDGPYYGVGGFGPLGGGQVSMGMTGDNKHRFGKQMVIDIFTPLGVGERQGDMVGEALVEAFRDPPRGVSVDRGYVTEAGNNDGRYQHSFILTFDYEDHG